MGEAQVNESGDSAAIGLADDLETSFPLLLVPVSLV